MKLDAYFKMLIKLRVSHQISSEYAKFNKFIMEIMEIKEAKED
jgi:hypothetical protein